MDAALQWGVDLILLIQEQRTPTLDAFFRTVTQLGGQWHIFIVSFVIWSMSYRVGTRMLLALLLSALLNFAMKDLLAQPRPFDMEARIGPDREMGYGLPSGHAQHTLVEWALIAHWVAQPWFSVLAAVLVLLIGFSRIYLGVHFPTDVIMGWALAGALLLAYFRHAQTIADRLGRLGTGAQIGVAAAVSLLFVLFYLAVPKTPYLVGTGGLFFGAGAGMALCHRYLVAPEGGAVWQRGLRFIAGIIVLLMWSSAAGKWVPGQQDAGYFIVIYLNLAVAGLWLTAGAPALFQVLRLSPPGRSGLIPKNAAGRGSGMSE